MGCTCHRPASKCICPSTFSFSAKFAELYPEWTGEKCIEKPKAILPDDSAERKKYPIGTGVLDYFPDAIAELALVSWTGNNQHNPGQPLHWAREKSMDQEDTMQRHYLERGTRDKDGMRHTAKMAWRALAILQLEIEREKESVK